MPFHYCKNDRRRRLRHRTIVISMLNAIRTMFDSMYLCAVVLLVVYLRFLHTHLTLFVYNSIALSSIFASTFPRLFKTKLLIHLSFFLCYYSTLLYKMQHFSWACRKYFVIEWKRKQSVWRMRARSGYFFPVFVDKNQHEI